jgi:hypothetical protein
MVERLPAISKCEELAAGDWIEARAGGQLAHRGAVSETASHLGFFWLMDTVTTGRKLLDFREFEIVLVPQSSEPPRTA